MWRIKSHQLSFPLRLLCVVYPGCVFRVRKPHQALTLRDPAPGAFMSGPSSCLYMRTLKAGLHMSEQDDHTSCLD